MPRLTVDEELAMPSEDYLAYIESLSLADYKNHLIDMVTYNTMAGNCETAMKFLELIPTITMLEREGVQIEQPVAEPERRTAPQFFK